MLKVYHSSRLASTMWVVYAGGGGAIARAPTVGAAVIDDDDLIVDFAASASRGSRGSR